MELTDSETKAKDYLLNLLLHGTCEPCDTYLSEDDFGLPQWFDEEKFKRGQKFCEDNRASVLLATFYGGISVICDPKTASILARGKSKSPASARNRGILTALGMTSWFRSELKPGSRSYESLKRIRKVHLNASRAAERNDIEFITQYDMSMQHFAVMGYVLTKPSHLGIASDTCRADKEAFVHFYAVIVHMLGIKEQFNMCLHELDVVEIICRCLIRYVYMPLLQLQTEQFDRVASTFMAGLNQIIPFSSYESQLFMIKRLNSVCGYQYNLNEEIFQRQIFSPNELNIIKESQQFKEGCEFRRNLFFDEKLYMLTVERCNEMKEENVRKSENWRDEDIEHLKKFYSLDDTQVLRVTEIEEKLLKNYLKGDKIHTLPIRERIFLFLFTHYLKLLQHPIIKMINNKIVDFVLSSMEAELRRSHRK